MTVQELLDILNDVEDPEGTEVELSVDHVKRAVCRSYTVESATVSCGLVELYSEDQHSM